MTWQEAEQRTGLRLDRRLTYCDSGGEVCQHVRFSEACSGCDPSGENEISSRGTGCESCGYTGRRRRIELVPVIGESACPRH